MQTVFILLKFQISQPRAAMNPLLRLGRPASFLFTFFQLYGRFRASRSLRITIALRKRAIDDGQSALVILIISCNLALINTLFSGQAGRSNSSPPPDAKQRALYAINNLKFMSGNKTDQTFWGYIGKAGVLIALIWGSIQIFSYLFKTGDFEASAKGNHSFYQTSPHHNKAYLKSGEYKALVRFIIEKEGSLKNYNLDTLLKNLKANGNEMDRSYFEMYLNQLGISPFNDREFSSIWTFTIRNIGNKPLEELALELPFDGVYKIMLPDNQVKENSFTNKIEIGELRPSYEASIYCWTRHSTTFIEDDEEKSRFTHKNGWFGISYPAEVTGFYAWNKKNDNFPIIVGSSILLFAYIVVFALGERSGAKEMKAKMAKVSKEKVTTETKSDDVQSES